ncbi:F-box protein fbw2 [Thalictrum thalictroides]|uniref:F-box protein fbw2 n=1 Tax=Thalictrum thalictroides TaxID=46969 RepID=A0A7J6W5G0_THATH|nr:F-box protein fbw2 [Thalictrum thalictroides]
MEGGSELRRWDELIPDALGMIFCNLSLQELLTVIPRVCKSWGKAVAGPYCWQEIDIDEWSTYCPPEHILPMVRMLIMRSGRSLRKLCVSSIPTDEAFSFIADHAGSLQELRISRSEISNSIVEKCAQKLSTITFLDVSYCLNIEASALEAIGKHCKSLLVLHRVMHPLTVEEKICQDDEAHAIATTMPKLKQLELAYALVSTEAVLKILLNCRQLEYLDLRGCWNVKLEEDFLKDKFSGLKVLGPIVEDSYEMELFENCTDFSETSSYLAWEVLAHQLDGVNYEDDSDSFDEAWDDDEQRLEELELRFYEGFNGAVGDAWPAWPASP